MTGRRESWPSVVYLRWEAPSLDGEVAPDLVAEGTGGRHQEQVASRGQRPARDQVIAVGAATLQAQRDGLFAVVVVQAVLLPEVEAVLLDQQAVNGAARQHRGIAGEVVEGE